MNPLLLIDADFFLYRAVQSSEIEMEFNPDCTVIVGDFPKARGMFQRNIKDLKTRFDTDNVLLTFTDRENFRKDVDPNYKGNRTKRKPAGYVKAKRWAMETYESVVYPRLEADDTLGILATNGSLDNFILVSPDKDMAQIPCRIYDLKREYTQTEEAARHTLFMQTLHGDSTDGYRGAPGIGPKRAAAILADCKDGDYWPHVVKAYEEVGLSESEALQTFYLARILRHTDWDADKQVPLFPYSC